MLPMMYRDSWMPEVFNDFLHSDFLPRMNATAPAVNVKENRDAYTVELAAPGLTKDDFVVNLDQDGNLVIKMEQKHSDEEEKRPVHYLRREFSYSKYEQTLLLPDDVECEKISAKVADGVLTISLPKQTQQENKVQRSIKIG